MSVISGTRTPSLSKIDNWYNNTRTEEQLVIYKVYTTIDQQITSCRNPLRNINDLGMAYERRLLTLRSLYVEKNGMVVMVSSFQVLEMAKSTTRFGIRRSPDFDHKPLAVYGPAIQENLIHPFYLEFTQTQLKQTCLPTW